MKDLHATAEGDAGRPIEVCFDQLADVESYPRWYPAGVKRAEPLERAPDGQVTKLKTTLAISRPIQREFRLHLAVMLDRPERIELRRLPKEAGDPEEMAVVWRLHVLAPDRTRVAVDLAARLDVPRFIPVGGIVDGLAKGFLGAAVQSLNG